MSPDFYYIKIVLRLTRQRTSGNMNNISSEMTSGRLYWLNDIQGSCFIILQIFQANSKYRYIKSVFSTARKRIVLLLSQQLNEFEKHLCHFPLLLSLSEGGHFYRLGGVGGGSKELGVNFLYSPFKLC